MVYIESPLERVVACQFDEEDEPPPDPPDPLGWPCGSYRFAYEWGTGPILGTDNPFIMRLNGEPDGESWGGMEGGTVWAVQWTWAGIVFGTPSFPYYSPYDLLCRASGFRVTFSTWGTSLAGRSGYTCAFGISHGNIQTYPYLEWAPSFADRAVEFGPYPGVSGMWEYDWNQKPEWSYDNPNLGRYDPTWGNDIKLYSYNGQNISGFGFLYEAIWQEVGAGFDWTMEVFRSTPPPPDPEARAREHRELREEYVRYLRRHRWR